MQTTANKLFQLLTDALARREGFNASAPVTVAEIYQEIVPYREVRERLGVELNADYEQALLELLAGEGGLLRLEPASAREELRQELRSPNPYVGLYRKFAACDVWIEGPVPAPEQEEEAAPEPAARPSAPATGAPPVPPATSPAAAPAAAARPEPAVTATPRPLAATPSTPSTPGKGCAFCSKPLPVGRNVRFCPHCGSDQSSHPCAKCGEVLEKGWRYCIACGAAAPVA